MVRLILILTMIVNFYPQFLIALISIQAYKGIISNSLLSSYTVKIFGNFFPQHFQFISKTDYGTILVIKLSVYEYRYHLQLIRT